VIDLDFGTYPYVTSSNPTTGSSCTGLGMPPQSIRTVVGIVKAYCTRVGEGPFPTELTNATGEKLRASGHEFGTTTGRPRRCGWLDIPELLYSNNINGANEFNLTKVDVLTGFDELKIGVAYMHNGKQLLGMPASLKVLGEVVVKYETLPGWSEDISNCHSFEELPQNCQRYVRRIEELIGNGVRIRWIGVGPDRDNIIDRNIEKAKTASFCSSWTCCQKK
jgi:adenylosuccinate synthase